MLHKRLSENRSRGTSASKTARSQPEDLIGMLNVPPASLGAPEGHSSRVAAYAVAIGRHLDLPDDTLNDLKSAAALHDIGKVGISRQIVNKLGRLTEREFEIMRLHSTIAIRMLERIDELKGALPMIKHHHERFDGKGYPDGLQEHDIPLGARVIAVAETFDILVSDIPWRNAMPLHQALDELRSNTGTQFDPMVVDAFVSLIEAKQVPLPGKLCKQLQKPRLRRTRH